MKTLKSVSVLLLSLFVSHMCAAQHLSSESVVEKQITATLHQMYEAEKRRDIKFVLAHLAEDFAEVAGDGKIYHRSDIEAGWADVELRDYQLSNCVFKLMTENSAYLSCEMQVNATFKGRPFPKRFRVTTFWTRQQNQWLIRFEQGTIIPDTASNSEKPE